MPTTHHSLARSLESTSDPAFAVNARGEIIVWNSAAEAALGHSRECVLARPCHEVVSGLDCFGSRVCQRDCLVVRSARLDNPVRRFRMYVTAGDGDQVESQCSVVRTRSSDQESVIIHLLLLGYDSASDDSSDDRPDPLGILRKPVPALTPREMEIIELLAEGKSTGEVIQILSLDANTVQTCVGRLKHKLGARNIQEAVAAARSEGLA